VSQSEWSSGTSAFMWEPGIMRISPTGYRSDRYQRTRVSFRESENLTTTGKGEAPIHGRRDDRLSRENPLRGWTSRMGN
jgi:hypothetical protein